MADQKTMYQCTTFFKKRPDISEQLFYDHWGNVHGPLVVPWALKHGVKGYVQYQTTEDLRALCALKMNPEFNGSLDFNAAADWYFEDYETYMAAYNDPYYIDVIMPDEDTFVDKTSKTTIMRAFTTLGVNRYMIEDGVPVVDVAPDIMKRFNEYQARKKVES